MKPLMDTKIKQFRDLFESYIWDTKLILQQEKFEENVISSMLEQYKTQFEQVYKVCDFTYVTQTLESEIKQRRALANIQSSVVKIQAFLRGNKQRRAYVQEYKRISHRNKIVDEILQTERSFVKSLETMIDVFYKPLQDMAFSKNQILSSPDIALIFSNIETILGLNHKLLKELEVRYSQWSNTQKIGDVFQDLAPFFKLYAAYVKDYQPGEALIVELLEKNPAFENFLKENATKQGVLGINGLQNFRIMPVQRIPRYVLLLTDLLKYTPSTHPDYESLKSAVETMGKLAQVINTSKGESDNRNKVYEIQERLGIEDLVQPQRVFVREGVLIQESAPKKNEKGKGTLRGTVYGLLSSWTSTFAVKVFLFTDVLITATQHAFGELRAKVCIDLSEATLDPIDTGKKGFCITINKGKSTEEMFFFYVEKEQEWQPWLDALRRCIQSQLQNKKTLKKDLKIKMPRIGATLESQTQSDEKNRPSGPPTSTSATTSEQPQGPLFGAPNSAAFSLNATSSSLFGGSLGASIPSPSPYTISTPFHQPTQSTTTQQPSSDSPYGATNQPQSYSHSAPNLLNFGANSNPSNPNFGTNHAPLPHFPSPSFPSLPEFAPLDQNQTNQFQNQNQTNQFQNQNQTNQFQNQQNSGPLKPTPVSEALTLYKQMFDIESEIFSKIPELQQQIQRHPQLQQQLPSLQRLMTQLTQDHERVLNLLKDQRTMKDLISQVYGARDQLQNLVTTIGKVFPKGCVVQGAAEIKQGTAMIMQWYFKLWDLAEEVEKLQL